MGRMATPSRITASSQTHRGSTSLVSNSKARSLRYWSAESAGMQSASSTTSPRRLAELPEAHVVPRELPASLPRRLYMPRRLTACDKRMILADGLEHAVRRDYRG